jgi:hypothetical protein
MNYTESFTQGYASHASSSMPSNRVAEEGPFDCLRHLGSRNRLGSGKNKGREKKEE